MRSTFDELEVELGEVRALVESITPVNDTLSAAASEHVRNFLVVRKKFDYAAFIVAVYAAYEKFSENLASAIALSLASSREYSKLPESLRTKHLVRSAEILSKNRYDEGKYEGLKEADVVQNLFECISGKKPYALNRHAITAHDFNLRPNELVLLFKALGIEDVLSKTRETDPMVDWFQLVQGMYTRPSAVPREVIDAKLTDIVQRRNQIAHKGSDMTDLLDSEGMLSTLNFADAFCRGLYVVGVFEHLRETHIARGTALDLGPYRMGPIKNDRVVVVDHPKVELKVGQPVFITSDAWKVRWGRIQKLQIRGENVREVEADSGSPRVGLEVDFMCTPSSRMFLMNQADDLVWPEEPMPTKEDEHEAK